MPTERPNRILVAIDLSDWSERVFMSALQVAKERKPTEVHLLAVAELTDSPFSLDPNAGQVPPEAVERLKAYALEKLEMFRNNRGDPEVTSIIAHVLLGSPADEIVWLAAHIDADLIVLGTHGRRGIRRFFLGSVAERVTRMAGCPVLIERPKEHDPKVVVPEIEPPPDENHPPHYIHNHHYRPVYHSRPSVPSWGGLGD